MEKFVGTLMDFSETGTEGIIWAMHEAGKIGYEGLRVLNFGDYVTIFTPDKTNIVWQGYISLEYDSNCPASNNPYGGRQAIGNYWVNGIQEGVSPTAWLYWFQNSFPVEVESVSFGHFYGIRGSSLIQAYSFKDEELTVKFKNGGFYRYKGVSETVANNFGSAASVGSYFIKNIRHKFESEKIDMPKLSVNSSTIGWTIEEEDEFQRIDNGKQN